MENLIEINYENENPTVSGRELYKALEVNTPYTQWFDRMREYGFTENKDYRGFSQKSEKPQGGRPVIDHQITISMAKEICMLQRNEKGKMFREYFISVEAMWNTPEMVMQRALSYANKAIEKLQKKTDEQEKQIELMKPKERFADAVADCKQSMLIREVAKIIKQNGVDIGGKRFFEWLREKGYLIKSKGGDYNMPTQRAMDMKLFSVKESVRVKADGSTVTDKTAKVTGKGQIYFIDGFVSGRFAL